jgi:hypothetical protein
VLVAPIAELATVSFSALVVVIVWYIVVTVLHTVLTILRVAVAAKPPVADQQVLGCGLVAAKVAARFRKMNMLVAATVQRQVAAAASAIFVKNLFTRLFVLVSVHQNVVPITTLVEESLRTWVALLVAAAPNYNDVILHLTGGLVGEACVSAANGIKAQVAGVGMITMKAAMLDLLGLVAVVYKG